MAAPATSRVLLFIYLERNACLGKMDLCFYSDNVLCFHAKCHFSSHTCVFFSHTCFHFYELLVACTLTNREI